MTRDELIEKLAKAISGAPLPSVKSRGRARAVLAEIDALGLAVVPKEPTLEMMNAGWRTLDGERDTFGPEDIETGDIYRAMLAAAQSEDGE